jgi:hypothetical protein
MADTVSSFNTNNDGSAVLTMTYDITGVNCNVTYAQNDTPFTLPIQTDTNGNIIVWTKDTAETYLTTQIATSKEAFIQAITN